MIEAHETDGTGEEHACNEHFRVLNFLYLSFQSGRVCLYICVCAAGIFGALHHHHHHHHHIRRSFRQFVTFPPMKLLLIDLSNFSLFVENKIKEKTCKLSTFFSASFSLSYRLQAHISEQNVFPLNRTI